MPTVSLQEAQANLPELVHRLAAGEEVIITENDQPVAKIVPANGTDAQRPPRVLGSLKGTVLYMAPDFDAPLDDFADYM